MISAVEGEDAVNVIQQQTAVAPVVEIRHRNSQPVADHRGTNDDDRVGVATLRLRSPEDAQLAVAFE